MDAWKKAQQRHVLCREGAKSAETLQQLCTDPLRCHTDVCPSKLKHISLLSCSIHQNLAAVLPAAWPRWRRAACSVKAVPRHFSRVRLCRVRRNRLGFFQLNDWHWRCSIHLLTSGTDSDSRDEVNDLKTQALSVASVAARPRQSWTLNTQQASAACLMHSAGLSWWGAMWGDTWMKH